MTTLSKVIREWLAEYKALTDEELHTYASTICQNDELIISLYHLLESSPTVEILDPVCHQLFEFYRSTETELRRFTLEFIPTLVWLYLTLLSLNGKKSCGGVEAFLLAIYNLEIVTSDGKAKVKTFRIPSFGQASVFHEPISLSSLTLTEIALSRYDQTESETWASGPYPQHEAINGQNRQGILAYLLQCYNAEVANLSARSHQMLCKAYSGVVTTGFSNLYYQEDDDKGSESSSTQGSIAGSNRSSHCGELIPRIAISPTLLIEMLSGLYYVMFNGQMAMGAQAILDLHYRAGYELYADVQLVTNAIRNSLRDHISGQPEEGPMGINVSVSPSVSSYALSKSAITNASFRTKKLPDDITIPAEIEAASKLATIEEDGDVQKPSAKHPKGGKQNKKMEKSKSKELKKDLDSISKSSVTNGDVTDAVQVAVVRSSSKTMIDNIEMQPLSKHMANSEVDQNSSSVEDGTVLSNKHRAVTISTSISNKDLKTKHGHIRHPSTGSVSSYSTDL